MDVKPLFEMELEFKMKLKDYDQEKITKIFSMAYSNRLSATFSKSDYNDGSLFTESDFCVGSYTSGGLLLIRKLEVNVLKFYIECGNKGDLNVMKKVINEYFLQVITVLNKNRIRWYEPEATIKLENFLFYGIVKTRCTRVREIFQQQREKLILAPTTSTIASYLAIQFNILGAEDAIKDIKKSIVLTMEAYIGLILIFIIHVVAKSYKKEFIFKI